MLIQFSNKIQITLSFLIALATLCSAKPFSPTKNAVISSSFGFSHFIFSHLILNLSQDAYRNISKILNDIRCFKQFSYIRVRERFGDHPFSLLCTQSIIIFQLLYNIFKLLVLFDQLISCYRPNTLKKSN